MRLFLAIKTSRTLNAALKHVSSSLQLFGKGSFCSEELYHITLVFIGESIRTEDIKKVMDAVDTQAFDISLNAMGAFDDTYYVGVSPSAELNTLQEKLTEQLITLGFDIEKRPFVPHITLARRYKCDMPPMVFVPSATERVESFCLMESKGGKYIPLYTKKLSV